MTSPPPQHDINATRSGSLLIAAGIAVAGAAFLGLAGQAGVMALATVLLDGWAPALDLLAATMAGVAVVRRCAPAVNRALLLASGAGVGLGMLITATLLLGLAGWLHGATAWSLVAVLAVLGAADLVRDRARWRTPLAPQLVHWLLVLPAAGVGIALFAATLPPGVMWGGEPHGYDVVSYHLQIPREWYEAGQISPLPHNVFSHFPLGQELLSLLLMQQLGGPWEAMYAAQFTSLLLMILAMVAIFGAPLVQTGEGTAAPPVNRVAGALLLGTLPWTSMLGSVAYNEALLLLSSTLVAAWLVRAVEGDWRPAMLAGVFAGLGVASKYPAVPMLGGGAVALAVVSLHGQRRWRFRLLLAAFAGGAMVFSLPWLMRNLAWSGNPFFPLATSLLGDGGWSPELVARFNKAHALAEGQSRFGRLWSDVLVNPRFAFVLWPAALVAALALLRRRDARGGLLLLWLALMFLVWFAFTHGQGRFLVVAVPPAVLLVCLAAGAPRLLTAAVVIAVSSAVLGLGYAGREASRLTRDRAVLVGIDVLVPFEDPERFEGADVYLVGDARALLYPSPRLHYKVVFNVPSAEGALRAWLGDALEEAPDDALVVIDPPEVARLHRTYGTPLLEIETPPQPFVWTMQQVRSALGQQRAAD